MAEEFPMDGARGYAVARGGEISIRTASWREEAAMVNGLCLFYDIWPQRDVPDDEIRRKWAEASAADPMHVEIVEVEVIPYGGR